MDRRSFMKRVGLIAAGLGIGVQVAKAAPTTGCIDLPLEGTVNDGSGKPLTEEDIIKAYNELPYIDLSMRGPKGLHAEASDDLKFSEPHILSKEVIERIGLCRFWLKKPSGHRYLRFVCKGGVIGCEVLFGKPVLFMGKGIMDGCRLIANEDILDLGVRHA